MRAALVLPLILLGCFPRRTSSNDAGVEAVATASAAISAGPVPSGPPKFHISMATFDKSTMTDCTDLVTDLPDAGGMLKEVEKKKSKNETIIPKPCAEQFKDRKPLATCSKSHTGDAGYTATFSMHYYDFEAVGLKDNVMKACLEEKGDWDAISRDSLEWKKAKLDYDSARLRKLGQQLGQEEP